MSLTFPLESKLCNLCSHVTDPTGDLLYGSYNILYTMHIWPHLNLTDAGHNRIQESQFGFWFVFEIFTKMDKCVWSIKYIELLKLPQKKSTFITATSAAKKKEELF